MPRSRIETSSRNDSALSHSHRCPKLLKRDASNVNAFGPRFGRLVRSCRDDLGLSIRDLALRIWDDEGRKASISRLENGHVRNPAARTVQVLAHALDISQDAIDNLREPPSALPALLDGLLHAGRNQLEALALRFEIDRVFAQSDAELRALLENKAQEYRNNKRLLKEIGGGSQALSDIEMAARDATTRLDFTEFETLMRKVDKTHSAMAVRAKEARARNALMRGKADAAFISFSSAAETLRSLDPLRATKARLTYHRALFEHGLRYEGTGLARAAEILRPALASEDLPPNARARAMQNLANALANMGVRMGGTEGGAHLDEAITTYRDALDLVAIDTHQKTWSMVQQNLGGALSLRAGQLTDPTARRDMLKRAVVAFDKALRLRPRATQPEEWAMTTQNLAVVLLEQSDVTPGPEGCALLDRAARLLEDTLTVRNRLTAPFEWALTQENQALVALAQAERQTKEADINYALASAAQHVIAALEVYHPEHHTFYHEKARLLAARIDAKTFPEACYRSPE